LRGQDIFCSPARYNPVASTEDEIIMNPLQAAFAFRQILVVLNHLDCRIYTVIAEALLPKFGCR